MKEITLASIALENFKGIKKTSIEFGGLNTNIYGHNASGKTTHLDAFIWCMFNKDSLNSANFEIKALDLTGEPAHNLTHSVTVVLDVDGTRLTLTKSLTEKWTRKRGEKSKEFTGHTTTYFLDEVPVKKGDYDKAVNNIIDEKSFRLLTDARFFNEQMQWKERRDLIMSICGDVSVQDVINVDGSLEPVTGILGGRAIDDARLALNSQRKEINKELEKIPVRVDEANRGLYVLEMPAKDAETGLKALSAERKMLEKEKVELARGGQAAKLRVELQEVKAQIQQKKNEFVASQHNTILQLEGQIVYLEDEHRKANNEFLRVNEDISSNEATAKNINAEIAGLRKQWHDVDSMPFEENGTCPTCGQALPADQIKAASDKFRSSQAEMLKSINKKGKTLSETLSTLASAKNASISRMKKISESMGLLKEKMVPIEDRIKEVKAENLDISELTNKVGELEKDILEADTGEVAEATDRIDEDLKKNALETDIRKDILAKDNANKSALKRILELKGQEESLVEEVCELEKNLFLLDELTRAKVNLLEERINARFKVARFKMFSDQINGGLQETCETTLDGVPYGSMNSAGRIQVGLDIIATLQGYYGVSCPIWIDNRESVVDIPEIDAQVISLIVSEKDSTLRIEQAENKKEKAA